MPEVWNQIYSCSGVLRLLKFLQLSAPLDWRILVKYSLAKVISRTSRAIVNRWGELVQCLTLCLNAKVDWIL